MCDLLHSYAYPQCGLLVHIITAIVNSSWFPVFIHFVKMYV